MPVSGAARAASGSWTAHGACLDSDPDLFFPIARSGPAQRQAAQAKAICARCLVRIICLSYALETGQDAGVWGGTTEDERRQIRAGLLSRGSPLTPTRPPARGPAEGR